MTPEISIVIPVYNGEKYIHRRVQEVMYYASLDIMPIELIFVNDGSTDNTAVELRKYQSKGIVIVCNHESNQGTFQAERTGLSKATGKYVYFHDQDDLFNPDLLNELYKLRTTLNPCIHIAAPTYLVYSSGNFANIAWHSRKESVAEILKWQLKNHCSGSARRSLFEREMLTGIYDDIDKMNLGLINTIQDAVVLTYMFGKGIFKEIFETENAYLWTCDNPKSVTQNFAQREKEMPVLMKITQEAINNLTGTHESVADYYDNLLPQLKKDTDRLGIVKVKLGSIVKRGENILDIGCGTGFTSKFMAQLGAKVTAVDISPKLIEYAKKNSMHKNVEYYEGDITEIDFTRDYIGNPKQFDGIVLVDVFEHVPRTDIDKLIANIDRHSTDHTWLFLNIPDERFQIAARQYIPEKLQIIDEDYSIGWLIEKFKAISYEVLEINIYGIEAPCQYNTFLFQRKDVLANTYRLAMEKKE